MKLIWTFCIIAVCSKKLDESALKTIFSSLLDTSSTESRQSISIPRKVQADPIQKVNRFLTLGGLNHYYESLQNKTDPKQTCQKKWTQVGNLCMLLLNRNQKKTVHKRSCLKSGAKLVSVKSKNENDDILKFLNESNFDTLGISQYIWLGMNSGKQAGTYVIDNARPPMEIKWFNWDQYSDENDARSKNSIQMNIETGTWFRTTGNDLAAAICSKPIL